MGLSVVLSEPLAGRLRAAADAAGVDVDELVQRCLRAWLDDWAEDLNRLSGAGENVLAETALARFEADVAARLASPR